MLASSNHSLDTLTKPLRNARVIAGVDFGTANSGFAIVHKEDADQRIEGFYNWPGQPVTLTAVPIDDLTGKAKEWGYVTVARSLHFARFVPPARIATGKSTVNYYEKLKLCLEPATAHHVVLPPGVVGLDIISEYLHCMWGGEAGWKAQRTINGVLTVLLDMSSQEKFNGSESFVSSVRNEDIQWCLTIQAIWSDTAKKKYVRRAAVQAGIIPDISSPRLTLILEPEAAAVYCCKSLPTARPKDGEVLMVVDAGAGDGASFALRGGTVDIVVNQVSIASDLMSLKEVTRGDDDACGATFLDDEFLKFLGRKVGTSAISRLRKERSSTYSSNELPQLPLVVIESAGTWDGGGTNKRPLLKLSRANHFSSWAVMSVWEGHKRTYSGDSSFPLTGQSYLAVPLPVGLYNLIDRLDMQSLRQDQDDVRLRPSDMADIFNPVVDRTLQAVTSTAEETSNPTKLQGAVYYGLELTIISGRRARRTYGLLMAEPYERFRAASVKPADLLIQDGIRHVKVFEPIVRLDQELEVDKPFYRMCSPLHDWQTGVMIDVFLTNSDVLTPISISNVPGLIKCGSPPVPLPTCEDKSANVGINFGMSEIRVVAVESTGEERRIS
ncbi:hypothetical protein BDK51DRAFT_42775 [Blyttiomyces helicus]|uniref:Actin-like ATPase domain-containing protein n=1 Tax=Blyttiomyces helicus TaxID=388810 RepID=A0A4P9WID9_9FUNG|nr:hypothetical protein BDK51DRAFT_42775 [Blyttiomyces helicus]|eukprot:RKO92639.1 hypothetical protein BDK51DRAFT_42775 [Blyttiomyces helicus]